MNLIPGDGRDWSDEDIQRALHAHYLAPSATDYWSGLESRILARIRAEAQRSVWSHFPGWVRYGLAAAAVAAFVMALASWQTRVARERLAVKELFGTPSEIPLLTETLDRRPLEEREKTLRYLITH
jgi:anti-sigma-K factor RskA